MRNLQTATRVGPQLPQLEKNPCSNEDPEQPKFKNNK